MIFHILTHFDARNAREPTIGRRMDFCAFFFHFVPHKNDDLLGSLDSRWMMKCIMEIIACFVKLYQSKNN